MLWFEDRLVPPGRVAFDPADRGLLLGDGVFDTALALGGRIAFEDAHVDRLVAAAATLGFAGDPVRIRTAMRALAATGPRLAVRTTLTRGPAPRGLAPPDAPAPVLFASAAPTRAPADFPPVRLHLTGIRRNETSPAARLKTLGYLDAVLATAEAVAAGADEPLFLNTGGRLACTGTANLFLVARGRLRTPPAEEGVLPGITRAALLRLAAAEGVPAEVAPLEPAALGEAEAAFVTNSLRLLTPVAAIGARAFAGRGSAHDLVVALARGLRAAAAAACGLPPEACEDPPEACG